MATLNSKSPSFAPVVGDEPLPGYQEEIDDASSHQSVPPAVLVLSDHHIIREDPGNSNPKPLYELNRGVAVITNATTTVTFSRLDYSVQDVAGAEPSLKVRKRHLYSLEHNRTASLGRYVRNAKFADAPSFWCKSESKKTLGDLGLKIKKKSGFIIQAVNRRDGQNSDPCFVESSQSRDNPVSFGIEWSKKYNRHVWTDALGLLVAFETLVDGKHRLDIKTELQRPALDTLVALWCLKIWWESAKKHADEQPSGGWHEGNYLCISAT
ncbi:hypothetical protein PFICI_14979 [Pestalotiopsis fici W106-1]|uniref:Uncharacterized protein n=1 Tax=Pestalotiopsis fici (strain W106-1 / CGMCC3.15140) TaxID=1229662 RepID=W3WHW5_PESFW|nr:uncharacterized protein PFICI_14979 [Pestalotiopsis fici W106-1]ETS73374.1 hypothetical protein PFICI_14979 [Pestalotiopsis fici W106-1]